MSGALHVHHRQNRYEVPKVQAGGSRIKANVKLGRLLFKLFVQILFIGDLGDKAAFL